MTRTLSEQRNTKILIVSAVFPPEPVVSAVLSLDLAHALSDTHTVVVISPSPTRPMGYNFSQESIQQFPFKHIILSSYTHPKSTVLGRFYESYSFGKACYKYIREHKKDIDVIYANTWPLAGQCLVVKAAAKFHISSVVHIQDLYPETLINKLPGFKSLFYNLLLPVDKFTTRRCSKIVTISNGMRHLLTKTRGLPEDKLSVVYNWQDEKKYIIHKERNSTIQPFIFMFLGSLSPSAAIDVAVQAFISSELKNSKLVIAGGGPEKEKLEALAVSTNDLAIEFINAPTEMAGELQAGSDILLLTLKRGVARLALPSKLPAYMFSAKPIIATVDFDSDTAYAISQSGCGWVVEPENPKALASMMQKVSMISGEELQTMGLRGREYALQHFSKQANLSKLVSVIEGVLEK